MKMKLVRMILCVITLLSVLAVKAQTGTATRLKSTVTPYRIAVSDNKTTNLLFPYSILSIDRGNKDVLVQKAKGVENVLQVKAAHDSLKETNLTVITADGTLYSFLLEYAAEPSILNLNFSLSDATDVPLAILRGGYDDEARLRRTAELVAARQRALRGLRDRNAGISISLQGIYIQNGHFFFQLSMENQTNVGYDIGQLRFFIRDKEHSKRTAWQELEQTPVHILGNIKTVGTTSENIVVVALPKFTLSDNKILIVQLMEQNGGRHIELKVKNKALVQAAEINN